MINDHSLTVSNEEKLLKIHSLLKERILSIESRRDCGCFIVLDGKQ